LLAGESRAPETGSLVGDRTAQRSLARPAADPAGRYALLAPSRCLGDAIELRERGAVVEVVARGRTVGELRFRDGLGRGTLACPGEAPAPARARLAAGTLDLVLVGERHAVGERQREPAGLAAAFLLAAAIIVVVCHAAGRVAVALGQPRVMGEVLGGMAFGPTVLGALWPEAREAILPRDLVPAIGVSAQLGLVFYMFLIGLELDHRQLSGRLGQVAAISVASLAVPLALGIAIAAPVYALVGAQERFAAFALFMGVAMSVTAFPVLARMLAERRMLRRPVGAVALACAAADDVIAWLLLALAVAVATTGDGGAIAATMGFALLFCFTVLVAARPLLARVSRAYEEAGRLPAGWLTVILAGVLGSAWMTEEIGVGIVFGAFVSGLAMPRHAQLTEDVTRRVEDFVVVLLLPLFFASVGLQLDLRLIDRWELWAVTALLIVVAVTGKLVTGTLIARLSGFDWRSSAVIGTLLNTRGLTELIVLNLALSVGAISPTVFAMLVVMAIVTTLVTGPALRRLDPANELGATLEDEVGLPAAETVVVAAGSEAALGRLAPLAGALAGGDPAREVVLARMVRPRLAASARGGLQTENRRLEGAAQQAERARERLEAAGVVARSAAFASARPAEDLLRLAGEDGVAVLLVDGRRPLLGPGVPGGEVGRALEEAPGDVGVLVARDGAPAALRPSAQVVVPFGGADHDWAALELGARIAAAAPHGRLTLLAAAATPPERARATRLLADASLLVQRSSGVVARPAVCEPGSAGILAAADGADLLVLGLSERWRQEGLGEVRAQLARGATAPVLFVRRGLRPGLLSPPRELSRLAWSAAAPAAAGVSERSG